MTLNSIGIIVESCWQQMPRHFNHVTLDEFVVMPNHVHGIVVITENDTGTACCAPTDGITAIRTFGSAVAASLPTIVRSFKSAVTNNIHQMISSVGKSIWQRGYFEHVIRNDESLGKIRKYIMDNPFHWTLDKENPDRLAETTDEFSNLA